MPDKPDRFLLRETFDRAAPRSPRHGHMRKRRGRGSAAGDEPPRVFVARQALPAGNLCLDSGPAGRHLYPETQYHFQSNLRGSDPTSQPPPIGPVPIALPGRRQLHAEHLAGSGPHIFETGLPAQHRPFRELPRGKTKTPPHHGRGRGFCCVLMGEGRGCLPVSLWPSDPTRTHRSH